MAETRIIGAVAVKVRPVTDGFRRKTKAGILKELRDMEVKVDVEINADLESLKRKLRDLDGQKVTAHVDVDTDVDKTADKINKTLDDIEKKQRSRTIKFNTDRESIKRAIDEVQKELDKLNAKELKVKLNEEGLHDALDALRNELNDTPLELKYTNDNEGLRNAIKQIDSELAKFREIELSVDVNEEDLERVRERLLKDIQTEPIELKVDYSDIDSLRDAKKKLDAELKELSKVTVEVDADEHSIREFRDKIDDLIKKAESNDIDLSVNAFTADASAILKYVSRNRFVDFFVRVNKRSVAVAEGVLKSLAGWNVISKLGNALEDVVTNFDKIAVKGGIWSAAIGGIADSLGYLLTGALTVGDGLLDSIGTLAMMPALLATIASTIAINVAAWKNFGDAVNGDNDALKLLPPNARKAAESLRGAWDSIQKPVQRRFWDGMGDSLSKLADVIIPQFREGLTNAAFHVGEFGKGVADAFATIALNGDLKRMFVGLEGFFDNLADGAQPFIDAINTLGLRGSEYLPQFGRWLADLAKQFDDFVTKADEAGDINRWIEDGVDAFKDMSRVLGGTIELFQGITEAAYNAGHGGLSSFATHMENIGDIVNSEPFKSRLTRIFKGANEGASALNDGLKDLGRTFMESSDMVGTLLESLGDLAGVSLSGISDIIGNLKFQDGIQDAIDGMVESVKNMGPAFEAIGTIIGNFGSLAGEVLKGLSPIMNELTGMLADVMEAIVPSLEDLAPILSETLAGALQVIKPILTDVSDALSNMLDIFNGMPTPIRNTIVVLAGLTAGLGFGYKAFRDLSPLVSTLTGRLDTMRGRMPQTTSAIGKLAKAGGIAAGALIALQAIGAIATREQRTSAEQYANAIGNVTEAAANGVKSLQGLDGVFKEWDSVFGADRSQGIRDVASAIEEVSNPTFMQGVDKNFNSLNQFFNLPDDKITMLEKRFEGLGDELGNMVRNGNGPKAAKVFRQLADEFEKNGQNAQFAMDKMPGYRDALLGMAADAGVAVDDTDLLAWALSGIPPKAVDAARASGRIEGALDDLGITTEGTVDNLERFVDALFEAGLKTMDSRDASFAYEEQLKAVSDAADEIATGKLGNALNKNKDDFNKTTEAGRLANQEFQNLARDGMSKVTTAAKEGVGQDELQKKLQKTYDDLVKSGEGFGLSKEAAKGLAGEVLGIPEGVDIKTWMDDFARQKAEEVKSEVEDIPGYKEVMVAVAENGTTGEVQSKINEITGKEEFIFVTSGGTTVEVQKEIRNIEGVEREVYVTDDGTIVSTQENIDAMTGTEVDLDANDNATDVVNEAQQNVDGFTGKAVNVIAKFLTDKYADVKGKFDSIKEKAPKVVADFMEKNFPGLKGQYDSIKAKTPEVIAWFKDWWYASLKDKYNMIRGKVEEVVAWFKDWWYASLHEKYKSIKGKVQEVIAWFKDWWYGSLKGKYDSIKGKVQEVIAWFKDWWYSSLRDKYDHIKGKVQEVIAWFKEWWYSSLKSKYDHIKGKVVDVVTNFISKFFGNGGFNAMDGGMTGGGALGMAKGLPKTRAFKQFADGGVENHTAQIAFSRASAPIRIWAEPETGGEAYIPLSPSKRARSLAIWEETGRRLGVEAYADGGITDGATTASRGNTFNITNHYPQAEPTSVTINRSMQFAGMPGLDGDF